MKITPGYTIIGIDPEPSGAFCIFNTTYKTVIFEKSESDIFVRMKKFKKWYNSVLFREKEKHIVVIEKVWIHPEQSAQSMTKFMTSYGAWLGIIASLFSPGQLIKVAPRTWKERFNLVSSKDIKKTKADSYMLAKNFITNFLPNGLNDSKNALDYLKIDSNVNSKQVTDRSEALLIGLYGLEKSL